MKTLTLPRHAGKIEFYLRMADTLKFRDSSGETVTGIVHAIARDEIEVGRVHNLIGSFALQRGKKQLRNSAGRCIFAAMGYGAEEEELYLIPEVRAYFQGITELWPHWLFSSCFYYPSAVMIALCCIENLSAYRDADRVLVTYETEEMESFFDRCLETTAVLDSVAGVPRKESVQRLGLFRRSVGLDDFA